MIYSQSYMHSQTHSQLKTIDISTRKVDLYLYLITPVTPQLHLVPGLLNINLQHMLIPFRYLHRVHRNRSSLYRDHKVSVYGQFREVRDVDPCIHSSVTRMRVSLIAHGVLTKDA